MDCATGILIDLIDLDKSQDSAKQKCIETSSVPNDAKGSPVLELYDSIILCKELCTVDEKKDHHSPVCGVLINLDSPNSRSEFEEPVLLPPVEIKINDCNDSRFAEQNNCDLILHEKQTAKYSEFLKQNSSSSNNSGSSRNGVNFSWSPSAIYNDVDLLENEKFDFNLSMSSISPYRESDDVFLVDENVCKKCSCRKEKPPKLSTPQKEWSLLNAAFISEISEEASKVLTHLSAKKIPLQTSAIDACQFLSTSPNSSFSVSQHNDSGIEEHDCNFDGNEIVKDVSFKTNIDNCDPFFACPNETTHNSVVCVENVENESKSHLEVGKKCALEIDAGNSCKNIDGCNILSMNVIQVDADIFDKLNVNISDVENKENIPINSEGSESDVFVNNSSSSEILDCTGSSGDLILEKPSLQQKCQDLSSSSSKELSSLVRRDTFTVKSSINTPKGKITSIYGGKDDVNSRGEKKKLLSALGNSDTRMQQNASFNSRRLSVASNPRSSLIRKETYTVGPVSSKKDVSTPKNMATPLVKANHSTPNRITRMTSEKVKRVSSKMTTSTNCDSAPANVSTPSSTPKFSKGTASSGFKTPTMPKRTSILPSRLSYSQPHAAQITNTKTRTSLQQSTPGIARANSFQPPRGAVVAGSSGKGPALPGSKSRASSAGEISDSGIGKKVMPIKAVAPLSTMVKAPAVKSSSGTSSMSSACGNKGKPAVSRATQGLVTGHINAVIKSERSNSLSTPKSVCTSLKPRFLSQSDAPSTPVSLKKDPGIRRLSFVPTPKRFTPKRCSEKF